MQRILRYLLYTTIILFPFQDTILGLSPLGFVGSNISCLPLGLHGLLILIRHIYTGRDTASKRWLLFSFYTLSLSAVYIVLWGTVSHDINVIYKTFSMYATTALWIYLTFYVDLAPGRGIRYCIFIAFWLVIVGILACDLHLPGLSMLNSSIFHITADTGEGRWRSFCMEPSLFSCTVVSIGLAAAHYARTRFSRRFFVLLTIGLLLASRSKGGLLVLCISGFVILFLKKPNILRMILYIGLCLILSAAVGAVIVSQFNGVDLFRATTTVATRFSLAIWTVLVVIHHPLGVGFSGFYHALTVYLPQAMELLSKLSPVQLNYVEAQWMVDSKYDLDAKCFFLEYLASFGLPFFFAYFIFAKKTIRGLLARGNDILLLTSIFLLIGLSTYINGWALYAAFFILGIAFKESQPTPSTFGLHNWRLFSPRRLGIPVREAND